MPLNFDVIVVGSGPAGITAAIYLKRANLNVVMFDNNAPGGQINRISLIENYPGFPKIMGADLAYNMFMQTQQLDIPYKYGRIVNIIDKDDHKIVETDKGNYTCKAVIIATGRKPRELGLPHEKELIGHGISWCAICDGALFKDKDVVVVGGGNSALEESLYLSGLANKVNLVLRTDDFTGDEILKKRVLNNTKIDIYYDSEVTELNVENNTLESVNITRNDNKKTNIKASGMFIYIGFEPSIGFTETLQLKNNNGYIVVDDSMRTNVKGVYACGDVIEKELYQITTAIAEGSKAATSAIKDIDSNIF
jgi:thioredoxin reductase (NADPH)